MRQFGQYFKHYLNDFVVALSDSLSMGSPMVSNSSMHFFRIDSVFGTETISSNGDNWVKMLMTHCITDGENIESHK